MHESIKVHPRAPTSAERSEVLTVVVLIAAHRIKTRNARRENRSAFAKVLRHNARVTRDHIAFKRSACDAEHVDVCTWAPGAIGIAARVIDTNFGEREVSTNLQNNGVEIKARDGTSGARIKVAAHGITEVAGVFNRGARRNLAHGAKVDNHFGAGDTSDGECCEDASDGGGVMHVSSCAFCSECVCCVTFTLRVCASNTTTMPRV